MKSELIDFTEAVVSTAHSAKYGLCEHAGGPADGMPLLIWQTKESTKIIPLPSPDSDVSLPEIMEIILQEVWAELGTPVHGALVVEAYIKETTEEEAPEIQKGELAREFQENPKSIGECLTVLAFNAEGQMRHSLFNYKYNDEGLPEFGEELVSEDDKIGGQMVVVFRKFLDFINAK